MMQAMEQEQYVEFSLGSEPYALPIQDIHEIIKMQSITRLPQAQSYMKGVINIRGYIIPIVSLCLLFGLPEEAVTKATRIIIVRLGEETVGMIVDRVNKVTRFTDIQPPPEQLGSVSSNCLSGIGFSPTGLVGILSLNGMFQEYH
jgi:purine-binding chemotaxis protein CheW